MQLTSDADLTLVIEDIRLLQMVIAAASTFGKSIVGSLLGTVTGLASLLALDIVRKPFFPRGKNKPR